MLRSIKQCCVASDSLYERIRYRPEIKDKVKIAPKKNDDHSFRVEFIRSEGCVHGIYGISIEYPPNAIGNRGSKYGEGFPSTIETRILGKIPENSDIFNANPINDDVRSFYDDVRSFYDDDIEGLVKEIVRISDYLSTPLVEGEHQKDERPDKDIVEDI